MDLVVLQVGIDNVVAFLEHPDAWIQEALRYIDTQERIADVHNSSPDTSGELHRLKLQIAVIEKLRNS